MCSSLAMSAVEHVCTPHIICNGHACCPCHYLSTTVMPLLKAMHGICLFSWYYTYTIHCLQLAVDFYWCNTHHTQKSKYTSYFKVCHASGRPFNFNMTYIHSQLYSDTICFPMILFHVRHAVTLFFETSLCPC